MNALNAAVLAFLKEKGFVPSTMCTTPDDPDSMFKKNTAGEMIRVNIYTGMTKRSSPRECSFFFKEKHIATISYADLLSQSLPLVEYFLNH